VNGPFGEDVQGLAAAFPQYRELGASRSDLLSFGGFPEADGKLLFPAGLLLTTDPPGTTARAPEQASVLESVASSRYRPGSPRHPADGQTIPDLTRQDAYSFVKGVKLDGRFCEVGPLARSIVAGRGPGGRGVWARYLARVAEASLLAAAIERWLGELRVEESACPSFPTPTVSGQGYSVIEAPRGVLGHWVTLDGGLIQRYHIISPTTWNASPRDEAGVPGPIERALEGVPIADTADPIEAVRVVHSFDPCLQCAVH
jgi:Ni,Fe-hydrogenase I large subunit